MSSAVRWFLLVITITCGSLPDRAVGGGPYNTASYFGDSYQYVAAEMVSNGTSLAYLNGTKTNVEMWFKTARADCLLLLANGSKSLCALRLKAGRLEVEFQIDGSDKIQFLSPQSLGQFHDTRWHKVIVQRSGDEFSLSIDEKNLTFRTQQIVHDSVFVLDDGLHLGGVRPSETRTSRTSFRGCLADIRYNGQDVFHTLMVGSNRDRRLISIGTEESCGRQFDAENAELPVQFVAAEESKEEDHVVRTNQSPHLVFDSIDPNEKSLTSLHFDLKTATKSAPLFSSPLESPSIAQSSSTPAAATRSSVCFDILDGSFQVIARDESTKSYRTYRSRLRIDDGKWHGVDLRFDHDSAELIIDNSTEILFVVEDGAPPRIEAPSLGRTIRFGSYGHCERDRRSAEILKESTFAGCLHNIALNHRHYTLLNASAGRRLDVGCDRDLCTAAIRLDQMLSDRSMCDQPWSSPSSAFPEPDPFPAFSSRSEKQQQAQSTAAASSSSADHAQAIRVAEGGTVRLEPRHFYFLPASTRIAVPNRNIFFHVNQKPGHGKLTLLEHAVSVFTYQDVIDGKVNYTHDGLEQHDDGIEIELEIKGSSSVATIDGGVFTTGGNPGHSANWQTAANNGGANGGEHRYTLPVSVTPVNDAPVIELPNGPVLRLAQNTRLRISNQEILVVDSDHDPADVKIKVTYSTPNSGFFEHVKRPGLSATEFSQEDILNNYINFYHFGLMNGETTLVARDLWEEGKPITLSIHAFLVDFRQVANEGLNVFHNGFETITSANLEFSSNARNQSTEVVYRVIRAPKYGRLEYEDESGDWHPTRAFNQSQIDDGKIRYNSLIDEENLRSGSAPPPARDSFAFVVATLNVSSPNEYEFEIRFVRTTIKVFNPTPFVLNNTLKLYLSRTYLFAHTSPRAAFSDEIVYQLSRPPMYGLLYLVIDAATNRNRVLGLSSNFTQADIDYQRVFYQLRYVHYSVVNDYFQFKTSALGSSTNERRYDITYFPSEDDFKLINKTLNVQEGSLQRVTNTTLYLETKDSSDFNFTIYLAPKHGSFTLMAGSQMKQLAVNDQFTSADIRNGKLFYRHDDSETAKDAAYLIARASTTVGGGRGGGAGFAPQVPFWYSIKITLVNDNQPKRYDESELGGVGGSGASPSSIFYVVRRGEKILTNRDLWYVDGDTDFDPLQLRYSFPNRPVDGGFYYSKRPDVPLQDFTQDDVNSGSVLFRHFGPQDSFSWPFSVTDGKHHTPGQFVVNASGPFLRERRNTGLKVQRGTMAILSGYNLTMETNLNVPANDIVYKVISSPRYGKLLFVDPKAEEGYVLDNPFSQRDLDHFRILYAHNNATSATSKKDWIACTVYAGSLEETVKIEISIFDADDSLLRIVNLRSVRVDRGGVAAIDQSTLKAEHAYFPSKQITFVVRKQPSSGQLVLDQGTFSNSTLWHGSLSSAERFTQADVDDGKLHYVHRSNMAVGGESSPIIADEIVFDIYAPNVALNGIVLRVGIMEREITLTTRNITVDKGAVRILRPTHLTIASNFDPTTTSASSTGGGGDDRSSTYVFTVLKQPEHGWLQMVSDEDEDADEDDDDGDVESNDDEASEHHHAGEQTLVTFRYKDVKERKIRYVHDGSRTWKDSFVINVKLGDDARTQSQPKTIHVKVMHSNEKDPEIVRNEPLELQSRREAAITPEHLHVIDSDTPPEEISYRVTSPTNGHVAFAGSSAKSIVEFTQKDIDESRVVFVHSGGSDGGFYFSVSDGLHQLPARQFIVHAIELSVSLAVKQRLTLAPGATVALTAEYLKAVIGTADPSRIVFTVTKPPRFGVLSKNGLSVHSLSFTQQDLNRDAISYKQTKPLKKWESRDVFSFLVSLNESDTGERIVPTDDENKFRIFITYGAMDTHEASKYVRTMAVKVRENDKTHVNSTHINVSDLAAAVQQSTPLVFELAAMPDYGFLQLRGHNLSERSQFAPQDLLNNWLVYKHTAKPNSPNFDRMQFDLFPIEEPRHPLRIRVDVDVSPSPARKRTFQPKYLAASLKVVQGQRYQITTQDFLITTDPSAIPSIVYRVITQSTNGYFAFTSAANRPIAEFSQDDINENRLDFVHNGSLANSSLGLSISMKAPDDQSQQQPSPSPTLNHTIQILVERLTLQVPHFPELVYRQNAQKVLVTNVHLGSTSNGPTTSIFYNVTESPKNGQLLWTMGSGRTKRDSTVVLFTQADVDAQRIYYTPTKMETSSDSFTVTVFNDFNQIPAKTVQIRCVPALEQNDVKVRPDGTFLLSEDLLKVGSEIADRQPHFLITRGPAYGILIREELYKNVSAFNRSNPNSVESLREFTADEIKHKRVRYVNTSPVKHHVLDDGFFFELRGRGFQPARGSFRIYVVPGGGPVPTVEPRIPVRQPAPTVGPGGQMPTVESSKSSSATTARGGRLIVSSTAPTYPDIIRDHNIVIFILVPVVFVALIFIVVRRVRVGKERERRRLKEKLIAQQRQQDIIQPQLMPRSRPDLLDATLYSLAGHHQQSVPELSASSVVMRGDPLYRSFGTGERTASIKSAKGAGGRNGGGGGVGPGGGGTLPRGGMSLEKANKGMLTMATSASAISTPSSSSHHGGGYHTFFSPESAPPAPPPTTRMVTFDPGRTEIISSVPMCKVTPLMPKSAASTCSSSSGDDFRYAYQYSSSASEPEFKSDRLTLDRSPSYRQHQRKGPKSPIKQMKLKENQYWV